MPHAAVKGLEREPLLMERLIIVYLLIKVARFIKK
jgi:hypothetical protein